MTTVPEKGILKGFRGFNLNHKSDVLPPHSSRDFTAAIEALQADILKENTQIDETLNTLLNHITNFSNPHKLDFTSFYPQLKDEIYQRYILYFDKSNDQRPLEKDDFFKAISENPLMLCELIRLIVINENEKEENPTNSIDITTHGKTSSLSEPIYSFSRSLPGSNDYPYYNTIDFIQSTQTLPSGYEDYLLGLKTINTQIEFTPPKDDDSTVFSNIIIDYKQTNTIDGAKQIAHSLKYVQRDTAFAFFKNLESWGSQLSKVFSDSGLSDKGLFDPETLFLQFRVGDNDLKDIGLSNPFPFFLHMYSTGEGFIITVDYEKGQREFIIRQFINVNNVLYVIDDGPLIIPTENYSLCVQLFKGTIHLTSLISHEKSPYFQSYNLKRRFNTLFDPVSTERFILTNIRLRASDQYMYDYVTNDTDKGFTTTNQKQTVFMNYLEIHRGKLPDDYIADRLSATL